MAIPQSKKLYEPRSINHFEALEQTCRLRQLSRSGGKYFFPSSGVNQGYSTWEICAQNLWLLVLQCVSVCVCTRVHTHTHKVQYQIGMNVLNLVWMSRSFFLYTSRVFAHPTARRSYVPHLACGSQFSNCNLDMNLDQGYHVPPSRSRGALGLKRVFPFTEGYWVPRCGRGP
jgi:hypothetical protein